MVTHFLEEHNGQERNVLFRIVSRHRRVLERQDAESVKIEEMSSKEQECLNIKSEWGLSKLPGILVTRPKELQENIKKEEKSEGREDS